MGRYYIEQGSHPGSVHELKTKEVSRLCGIGLSCGLATENHQREAGFRLFENQVPLLQ